MAMRKMVTVRSNTTTMITSALSALNPVDLLAELLRLGSREGRDSVPEHHPELSKSVLSPSINAYLHCYSRRG